MFKKMLCVTVMIICYPLFSYADTRCGDFILTAGNDGYMHINGQRPSSQKLTFLKKMDDYENIKMQWMVPRSDYPGWLGMDYIKRNGKAILNVEAIRSNMDQSRLFGTYDCVKVK